MSVPSGASQAFCQSHDVNLLLLLDMAISSYNEQMISLDLRNSGFSKRNFSNPTTSLTLDKGNAMCATGCARTARKCSNAPRDAFAAILKRIRGLIQSQSC